MPKVKSPTAPRISRSKKKKSKKSKKVEDGPETQRAAECQNRLQDVFQAREIYAEIQAEQQLSVEKIRRLQHDLGVKLLQMWMDSWQQRQKMWNQIMENWRKIMIA